MSLNMILAPWGGFGNHLRWLLLLSDEYKINFHTTTLTNIDQKVQFIANEVYPANRTWNTWMNYEWKFRDLLNSVLKFTHDAIDVFDELKTIGCTIDPELAYRSYKKFDTDFNGLSNEQFNQMITKHNKFCGFAKEFYPLTVTTVDTGKLFNALLDSDLYEHATKFFNLTPSLSYAQEIHALWFKRQLDAENAFIEYKKLNNNPTILKPAVSATFKKEL